MNYLKIAWLSVEVFIAKLIRAWLKGRLWQQKREKDFGSWLEFFLYDNFALLYDPDWRVKLFLFLILIMNGVAWLNVLVINTFIPSLTMNFANLPFNLFIVLCIYIAFMITACTCGFWYEIHHPHEDIEEC